MKEIMYESDIQELQEKIASFEVSLYDVLLVEYCKRRRFTEVALEDLLKNSDDVEELQEDRVENYTKLDKFSIRFVIFSVASFIVGAAIHEYSFLILLVYIFIASISARKYFDVRSNDEMQLGNLVLCQFENQKIKRDLKSYGISEAELIRYKVYNDASRNRSENGKVKEEDRQLYWIELRIIQQICDGLKSLG